MGTGLGRAGAWRGHLLLHCIKFMGKLIIIIFRQFRALKSLDCREAGPEKRTSNTDILPDLESSAIATVLEAQLLGSVYTAI